MAFRSLTLPRRLFRQRPGGAGGWFFAGQRKRKQPSSHNLSTTAGENESNREVERILRSGTYFEVLDLAACSTTKGGRAAVKAAARETPDVSAVRKSFQRLVKLVHPDVCSHPRARAAFDRVSKAHEVLKSPRRAAQHATFVRREAKEATGVYAWLDEHAGWISPFHATMVFVAAAVLQVAVSLLRSAAHEGGGLQIDSSEGFGGPAGEAAVGGGGVRGGSTAKEERRMQQRRRREKAESLIARAANATASSGGGGGGGEAVSAASEGPSKQALGPTAAPSSSQRREERMPLGPAFSTDAGRPLVGYTSREVELRLAARRLRHRTVHETGPLKEQRVPNEGSDGVLAKRSVGGLSTQTAPAAAGTTTTTTRTRTRTIEAAAVKSGTPAATTGAALAVGVTRQKTNTVATETSTLKSSTSIGDQ